MLAALPDSTTIVFILLGSLSAGFVTGFAGFGTGLVASGFWFHVLPPGFVPPMVVFASVAGQLVSLVGLRPRFDWPRALPYLVGGALGVPLGVLALTQASPGLLRFSAGIFLLCYAASQLAGVTRHSIGTWGGRRSDAAVGFGGGILGGFAGLSGPLPLIWLQLRGGPSLEQRAVYQPFNLIVLALAAAGMAVPGTVVGAFLGARLYRHASEATFRKVVLTLLLASGALLVLEGLW